MRSRSRALPLVACIVLACGCRARRAIEPPPPAATAPVITQLTPPPRDKALVGVILAPATVDMASQLQARLIKTVSAGDRVAKGDIVAWLDTRAAQKDVMIAEAQVASAAAELRRAQLDQKLSREKLRRRSATVRLSTGATVGTSSDEERSEAGYDVALSGVKVASARASLTDKRAHRDQLKMMAEDGSLRAPFDCVVAQRYVDAGTLVRPGTPVVRLIEAAELRVRFAASEAESRRLNVGSPVNVLAGDVELTGEIQKIAPEIDAAARMIFIDASLHIPPALLTRVRSGEAAEVRPAVKAAAMLPAVGATVTPPAAKAAQL